MIQELVNHDWELICIVRKQHNFGNLKIQQIYGDLSKPESLVYKFADVEDIDVIFHLAAELPVNNPQNDPARYIVNNTLGTVKLLDVAKELNCRFIYTSSIPVIGIPQEIPITESHPLRPRSYYHLSKLFGELACDMQRRIRDGKIFSLRISSPYGPGMPENAVLAKFVNLALRSQNIELLGSGQRTQNFVHVRDIVNAIKLTTQAKIAGTYNLAGLSSVSMESLAHIILDLIPDSSSEILFSEEPDNEEKYRWDVDLTNSKKQLGYYPKISLEQGLDEYIQWIRSSMK